MNINIYNYLRDFEKSDLKTEHGIILEDENRMKKIETIYDSYNLNYYYSIDDNIFLYVKRLIDMQDKTSGRLISELLTSRIYEKNSVNCIKTFPFRPIEDGKYSDIICSASEDLTKIAGLNITSDNDFIDKKMEDFLRSSDIQTNEYISDEWLIVTNPLVKEYLLTHMSKEAYEQLIDLLIIDTLFYVWDRFGWAKNLFFAKTPNADKIEGVIPIDLESINFDNLKPAYNNSANKFLKDLYTDNVSFVSPQGTGIIKTYKQRILNLKRIMDEGYLNIRQVALIKNVLNSNISSEVEDILNKYNLDCNNKVIKVYKDMWNRNGEMLKI